MKLLKDILDKTRPLFEEGGKLRRFHSIFDAGDNAFFACTFKAKNEPFARDPVDIKRYMFTVIMAVTPAFLASIYFFGWRVLAMLIVSYVAGGIVEVTFAVVRKEEINEGFLVTGFLFPLILPPGLPLWMVAVGMVFGTLVGKEIFGGTGRNLFNPAIVGRCFLAFSYPSAMTGTWLEPGSGLFGRLFSAFSLGTPDGITGATPLVLAKGGELASTTNLLLGQVAGSAGETCSLAIIAGGIFLLITGISNWRTVVGVLASFTVLGILFRITAPDTTTPVLFNILSGGFLFGAFFMATDPVSSPVTQSGKWAYGVLIGSATILIRSFSGYVEGMMFAILLGNICAPLIDEVVIRCRIRRYALER
jgi:Na(+)-translocating NADH:ubiquinone oxidoreductase B subunit